MPFCQYCGKEIRLGSDYCPYCGRKTPFSVYDSNDVRIDQEEFRTFIGRNADLYLKKFRKFQIGHSDSFAATWHWPAFWLGFAWMLYRKMYLWALVAFIIGLTPVGFPLPMIGWGLTANYLYYLHAKKKIRVARPNPAGEPSVLPLAELGGVNRWVWFVGILLILFLLVLMGVGFLLLLHFFKYSFINLPDFLEV
jgi:hypothetical protein